MNETLSNELKTMFRLTDEQINAIGTMLGVENPEDMRWVTYDMLTNPAYSVKVLPVVANRMVNYYTAPSAPTTPAPATPATPAFPGMPGGPTIIVRTGRPEDMTLKELLDALASGERTLDYLNAIRKYSRNRPVFVRATGSDILDVNSTLALIQYADAGGDDEVPEFWGDDEQPTETLEEYLNQTFWANPITGKRLPAGNMWLKVPEDRRVLAAYARITKKLSGHEDEVTLVGELTQPDLTARWKPIQKAYNLDYKKGMETVIRAQAALRWFRNASESREERSRSRHGEEGGSGSTGGSFRDY